MSDKDYQDVQLTKNRWPEWQAVDGGDWKRDWHITFVNPTALVGSHPEASLGEPGLNVRWKAVSADEVCFEAVTSSDPMSDEIFFFAMYRLFQRIERAFGRIRTIEGQDRTEWRPFRGGNSA